MRANILRLMLIVGKNDFKEKKDSVHHAAVVIETLGAQTSSQRSQAHRQHRNKHGPLTMHDHYFHFETLKFRLGSLIDIIIQSIKLSTLVQAPMMPCVNYRCNLQRHIHSVELKMF